MILKKNNDKYEIDPKTTKIVLEKFEEAAKDITNIQESSLTKYRTEDNLYVVIQNTLRSAYLQDIKTGKIFEEVNFPDNVIYLLCNGAVIRYKNGKYIFEEELTKENMYPLH